MWKENRMAQRRAQTVTEYLSGRGRALIQQRGEDTIERQAAQEEFRNRGWALEYSQRRSTLMNEHEWVGFGAEYEALHGNSAWGLDLWTVD
jgi:hypothetical protein